MDDDDQGHHSDDSCLLHEFTSPVCSRAVSPARARSRPCCCSTCASCPMVTSSRPFTRLSTCFDDLNSRIDALGCHNISSNNKPSRRDVTPCCCSRWDVSLLQALRRDPNSLPERRRSEGGTTRTRRPGRADLCFTPRKGDLIIHHDRKAGRKVLEFYDPVCQRLHDGDMLVRFKIDSYACEGLVMVKSSAYLYHRGIWIYLGKDSDQIARSCSW